jgi:hypothetical protein
MHRSKASDLKRAMRARLEDRKVAKEGQYMSFTKTVVIEKTQAVPAPFPNTKGVATLKVLNTDQSLGPAVALMKMEPGSEIPRHMHEKTTETSYVLDGDFINEGFAYHTGTEFNIKPYTVHGPHTTKHGCSLLVTFSLSVYPRRFQVSVAGAALSRSRVHRLSPAGYPLSSSLLRTNVQMPSASAHFA